MIYKFVEETNMQSLVVILQLSELKFSPDAEISLASANVLVRLTDGLSEVQLSFSPYQALRVTTADCFELAEGMSVVPKTVVEVREWGWLQELKTVLSQVDIGGSFLEQSRHFLIPTPDDFIEIVAWKIQKF